MKHALIVVALLAGLAIGYFARPNVQDANDLLDVGFTIIDPEGFEIARFDE